MTGGIEQTHAEAGCAGQQKIEAEEEGAIRLRMLPVPN